MRTSPTRPAQPDNWGGENRTGTPSTSNSKSRRGTSVSVGQFADFSSPDVSRPGNSEGRRLSPMRVPPRLAYIHRLTMSEQLEELNRSPLYHQLERALNKLSPEGEEPPPHASKFKKKRLFAAQSKTRPKSAMETSLTAETYHKDPLPLNRSHLKQLEEEPVQAPITRHRGKKGKAAASLRREVDINDFTPLSVDDLQTTKTAIKSLNPSGIFGHGCFPEALLGSQDSSHNFSFDVDHGISFEEQKRRLSEIDVRSRSLLSAMSTKTAPRALTPARVLVKNAQELMDTYLDGEEDVTTPSTSRPSTSDTHQYPRGGFDGPETPGRGGAQHRPDSVLGVGGTPGTPKSLSPQSGSRREGSAQRRVPAAISTSLRAGSSPKAGTAKALTPKSCLQGAGTSPSFKGRMSPLGRSPTLRNQRGSVSSVSSPGVLGEGAARPRTPMSPLPMSSAAGSEAESVLDPRTVHGKLLVWAIGAHTGVASHALLDVRDRIWREQQASERRNDAAARKVQRNWRRYRHRKKFLWYRHSRAARVAARVRAIFSLWRRVIVQRPESRSVCSQFLIAWRVHVCELHIAAQKAADLSMIWGTVSGKRNIRAWRRHCGIERHRLRLDRWRIFGPWVRYVELIRRREDLRKKNMNKFLHHAIRALYFWARCAAKCRKRAYNLFRYFEDSLDQLSMPLARFPGHHACVFMCGYMLELWQWKDMRERKIMRASYVRLAPVVISRWSLAVDLNKRTRYARVHDQRQLLRRCVRRMKDNAEQCIEERMNKEENKGGRRRSSLKRDQGAMAAAAAAFEGDKRDDMNALAELVDHEEKEVLRRRIKEEKRKLVVRMRFEQLKRESEVLRTLPDQHDESMRRLDDMLRERDKQQHHRLQDERKVLRDEAKNDMEAWNRAVEAYKKLLTDAFGILTRVFDNAQAEWSAGIFYACWCYIRKSAGRVRIRRVIHRTHIQRLLAICARHRRMEKSIHKYRPLRVKMGVWRKWLRMVEGQYLDTTIGLKTIVSRARTLVLKISQIYFDLGRLLSVHEACQKMHVLMALWVESVHMTKARREVTHLWRMRRAVRTLHRCFDFLKNRVMWRARLKRPEALEKPWVERNATADLHMWKKKFFTGKNYAQVLRGIENQLKSKFVLMVKGSTRLGPLMTERRQTVEQRCLVEQRMLLLELDDIERREAQAGGQRRLLTSPFPMQHWGTVLNLRRNEIMVLLDRCDRLARVARREFDNAKVAFALSEWFFKVKCNGLPSIDDAELTRDKAYWTNIKNLFQLSRSGQVHLIPT